MNEGVILRKVVLS